jgi:thiol-disulfide isomerase/thioredoxin
MRPYYLFLWLFGLCIGRVRAQQAVETKFRVYVFLSDECPMCQGYAPVLNQFVADFAAKGIDCIGVFPNYYVTDSAINAFRKEFDLKFKTQRDSAFVLTNRFGATITPQVVLETVDGQRLYSGQLDNAYFRAGKRRGVTSQFYLRDAVQSALKGENLNPFSTQPIGCVIVRD